MCISELVRRVAPTIFNKVRIKLKNTTHGSVLGVTLSAAHLNICKRNAPTYSVMLQLFIGTTTIRQNSWTKLHI